MIFYILYFRLSCLIFCRLLLVVEVVECVWQKNPKNLLDCYRYVSISWCKGSTYLKSFTVFYDFPFLWSLYWCLLYLLPEEVQSWLFLKEFAPCKYRMNTFLVNYIWILFQLSKIYILIWIWLSELHYNLQQAKSEAAAAFGNDGVYLEKFIQNPRHIEFQERIFCLHHISCLHVN